MHDQATPSGGETYGANPLLSNTCRRGAIKSPDICRVYNPLACSGKPFPCTQGDGPARGAPFVTWRPAQRDVRFHTPSPCFDFLRHSLQE